MSELYINLPQLKKVPAELSGIPQDIRRKIQSLDSIEQYVKGQISGGGELQRQIQSIREELERIASSMAAMEMLYNRSVACMNPVRKEL